MLYSFSKPHKNWSDLLKIPKSSHNEAQKLLPLHKFSTGMNLMRSSIAAYGMAASRYTFFNHIKCTILQNKEFNKVVYPPYL